LEYRRHKQPLVVVEVVVLQSVVVVAVVIVVTVAEEVIENARKVASSGSRSEYSSSR
jgi:hypothetical protein